jgi:rRNA-processing protein FCF1
MHGRRAASIAAARAAAQAVRIEHTNEHGDDSIVAALRRPR